MKGENLIALVQFHEDQRPMNQFILHASLDIVEEMQWTQRELYLKAVDGFNSQLVSCFLTAGSASSCPDQGGGRGADGGIDIKLLLLHEAKNEDPIRQFFSDVHEAYLKTLMNPFYEVDMRITSAVFDAKVRAAAKKYL